MLRKLCKNAVWLFLFNHSDSKMALACSTGVLLGLLPLYGLRFILAFAVAILFGLNIAAIAIGIGITVLCPDLYTLITGAFDKSAGSSGLSAAPVAAAFLIILLVYGFGRVLCEKSVKDIRIIKKRCLAFGIGSFIGITIMYDYRFGAVVSAAILLVSVFARLNVLCLLAGLIPGASIFILFKEVLSEEKLPILLSGYQTMPDFISSVINGHSDYICVIVAEILIAVLSYPVFKYIFSYKSIKRTLYVKKFVFHDSDGVHWSKVTRTIVVISVIALMLVSVVITGLVENGAFAYSNNESSSVNGAKSVNSMPEKNKYSNKTYCFYVDYDAKSMASLKKNAGLIDVLIPCWYSINENLSFSGTVKKDVMDIANSNEVQVMPLVNNYVNGEWNGELVNSIVSTDTNRKRFISQLLSELKKNKFSGVNIDFESLPESCRNNYAEFIKELYNTFKGNGLKVTIDIQLGKNSYDLSNLSKSCDGIIVMLYDEHNLASGQGAVASRQWFEKNIKSINIPHDKIIVGMGLYGYDWNDKNKNITSFCVQDIMKMSQSYNANVIWDKKTGNPMFKYNNGKEAHTLWFSDSTVAYNEILFAQYLGIHQFSLWRLGSEDDKFWTLFNFLDDIRDSTTELSLSGETIENKDITDTTVLGEIVYGLSKSKIRMGKSFKKDEDGYINDVAYNAALISGYDEEQDKKKKRIALTFDDGPNKEYTPQILDILKRYNVKATFFVIGKNAWANPDILKRAYSEGHDIGNHTYSHPDLPQYSRLTTRLELNMTNKIIEIITGHSTMLFRQPYNVEWDLSSSTEAAVFKEIDKMGYAIVGSAVDPKDWDGNSPDAIVKNVDKQLGTGNIILFHDDSTNVKNTVKALPHVIEDLKKKGYTFDTVSGLLRRDRNDTMPPVKMQDSAVLMGISLVLTLSSAFNIFVRVLFIAATIIGVIRFVFLIYFATKQKNRHLKRTFKGNFNPLVSIVVAAYNEEKVICKTIRSILESTYENIEIIIVNDGSKDKTAEEVETSFWHNSRVRLISKENGGKSSSVNRGFKEANGEIVVVIDADTILDKDAISLLVRHFENDNVAAVSGNVKVGNKNNLITNFQHIEYVTGLNLERRAFDELNCIPVVPGAIGAWRKEYVAKAGYYNEDTLAEDADITLTFLEQGYKIIYEEGARAYTEAPEDLQGFLKQRLRWSYGTLQCLWKHKKSVFNNKNKILGFVALPNMWLYQFIFQALTPISEVIFILGLLGKTVLLSIITYMVFFVIDFLITLYAFSLEKEDTHPLKLYFFQRAAYKFIMTFVVYKSLISAFKGVKVEWNKLIRKGNVEKVVTRNEYKEAAAS